MFDDFTKCARERRAEALFGVHLRLGERAVALANESKNIKEGNHFTHTDTERERETHNVDRACRGWRRRKKSFKGK